MSPGLLALGLGWACAPAPLSVEAAWGAGGVEVRASAALERIELLDPSGASTHTLRPAGRSGVAELQAWPTQDGAWRLRVRAGGQDRVVPLPWSAAQVPAVVQVEAPVGQPARPLGPGDTLPVVQVDGAAVPVALTAVALRAGPLRVAVDGEAVELPAARPGERLRWSGTLRGAGAVRVDAGGLGWGATLALEPLTLAQAQEALQVVAVRFPAEASGLADPARDPDRVRLPSPAWQALLERSPLGFRPSDGFLPWAWQGVVLRNAGSQDLNVAVRTRVLGPDGAPAAAFAPRLREADDGTGRVSVLVQVPARGEALAALPIFVDPSQVRGKVYTREVEVTPLGLDRPLARWEGSLHVDRGHSAALLGLGAALGAAVAGAGLLLGRGPRWLREASTSELMTLAMLGALLFFLGVAGRLLAMGVAAALGPFGVLLTALVDDAARTALLATLLTLRPRPGTAALAMGVAWGLGALALGGLTPTDALFFCAQVAWTEGALWLGGVTRRPGWRDQAAWARWLRLSAAFTLSNTLGLATGLALSAVLYRLYYAPWYVALLLAGPGSLYVLLACALAVPFAASLRRVQP